MKTASIGHKRLNVPVSMLQSNWVTWNWFRPFRCKWEAFDWYQNHRPWM